MISVPSLYDMDTSPAPESVLYGLTGSGWLKSFDEDEETWNNLDNAQSSIGGNGFAIDNYRRAFVTKSNKLYEVDLNTGGIIEEWELDTPDLWIQSSGDCVVNKNNSFYMTSSAPATNDLIYVDPSTMKGVLVGNTGFSGIWGLTAAFGKLYGLTSAGQLLLIDPSTAETVECTTSPFRSTAPPRAQVGNGFRLRRTRQHGTTNPMPRPLRTFGRIFFHTGLFFVGLAQHRQQLDDGRFIPRLGLINGQLRQVIAQHVFGVNQIHALRSFLKGRSFLPPRVTHLLNQE